MELSRRTLFEEILASGGVATLLASQASSQTAAPAAVGEPHYRSYDFWGTFFDSVDPSKSASRGGKKKRIPFPDKEVRYLYYTDGTLAYTDQIKKEQLVDFPGDVTVNIILSQFRLSQEDQDAFKNMRSSQLRLDCVQTKPFMNIVAPLAWTALASLYPDKAGHLPSLQDLGFHTPNAAGGVTKVVLPSGTGKMAMNISMMKRNSVLQTILKEATTTAQILTPFLDFRRSASPR